MAEVSVSDLLDEYLKEEEGIRQDIRDLKIKLASKRETIHDIANRIGRQIDFPDIGDNEKGTKTSFKILPDTFFNKTHPDAAAEYLKMVGHAVQIDEILAALKKGGAAFKGGDHRSSLYTQLIRGTRRFVKIGDDAVFGLVSKYGSVRKSGSKTKPEKNPATEESNEEDKNIVVEDNVSEENEENTDDILSEDE